jgi:hypothetical protein
MKTAKKNKLVDQEDDELKLSSIHESAHTVIGLLSGMRLAKRGVEIEKAGSKGKRDISHLRIDSINNTLTRHVVVNLVGVDAECRCRGEERQFTTREYFDSVLLSDPEELMDDGYGMDQESAIIMVADIFKDRNAAYELFNIYEEFSGELIDNAIIWNAIQILSNQLYRVGRIGRQKVDSILLTEEAALSEVAEAFSICKSNCIDKIRSKFSTEDYFKTMAPISGI